MSAKTKGHKSLRERCSFFLQGHRLGVFLGMLFVSALCFQMMPSESPFERFCQTGALAFFGGAVLWLAYPAAGGRGPFFAGALTRWAGWVCVVGLIGGLLAGSFSSGFCADSYPELLFNTGVFICFCVLIAFFEESVFRVVAYEAFLTALTPFKAVGAAVILFGVMHISSGDIASVAGVVEVAQLILKPVQAGLFGFIMLALYLKSTTLWLPVGVHAFFNFVYLGPSELWGSVSQTYLTGTVADLTVLVVTTVLLIPPAVFSGRALWTERGALSGSS